MLSFFSRKLFNYKIHPQSQPFNSFNYKIQPVSYDTNLSKYVIDTTNKIKKDYSVVPYNSNYKSCICPSHSVLPVISMLSFLAGYYFSKYNSW
jgi:hypothetical protein